MRKLRCGEVGWTWPRVGGRACAPSPLPHCLVVRKRTRGCWSGQHLLISKTWQPLDAEHCATSNYKQQSITSKRPYYLAWVIRPTIGVFLTKYGTAKVLDRGGGCRITPASLTCSSLAQWYRCIISHLKFTINPDTYRWPCPMMGLNLTPKSLTLWSQSNGSQIWAWIKITWRIKV